MWVCLFIWLCNYKVLEVSLTGMDVALIVAELFSPLI
jgi:hypothetical protein